MMKFFSLDLIGRLLSNVLLSMEPIVLAKLKFLMWTQIKLKR